MTLADHEARSQAVDPARSFIVQAPAGSGKTFLLTSRILNLLLTVEKPEEILAITFTRKAAGEMRERVLKMLGLADLEPSAVDEHLQPTVKLAQQVLERDAEKNWRLRENPSRLAISTIDSMCAHISRQLPVTSLFGAPPPASESVDSIYLEAAQRTLQEALGSGADDTVSTLLSHLDNNARRLTELLVDMLKKRDQWRRHVDASQHRELLEEQFDIFVTQSLQQALDEFGPATRDQLPALLRHAGSCAAVLTPDSKFVVLRDINELPDSTAQSILIWKTIAALFLTESGTLRKTANRTIGFPVNKKDADTLGLDEDYLRSQQQAFLTLLGDCSGNTTLQLALANIKPLPDPSYTEDQWLIMQAMISLLRSAEIELQLVFAEHNQVDFTEIAMRARNALGDEENPTDLALAMDYRWKHILVDEFQDTSISQYELFKQLTAGWEPGDGRTFFAVGDPMQSIYRFRDAEVSLFERARRTGLGPLILQPLQLTVNFRSDEVIVDWCNRVFSDIFPSHTDATSGAVNYSPSVPEHRDTVGSEVGINGFACKSLEDETRALAQQIAASLNKTSSDEAQIAVLVRSRKRAGPLFIELQRLGVAYQALDMEELGDRLAVKDILSLLWALQHPGDRLHWLAVLRTPFCGIRLEDLQLLLGEDRQAGVWGLINDAARIAALSGDAQRRLEKLRQVLAPAIARAGREPLVPWVKICWMQLEGPATLESEVDRLAVNTCLTELLKLESEGLIGDRAQIIQRFSTLYAPVASGNASRVQIMTMHKSKGLEFDTVFLPFLGAKPQGDRDSLLNWVEVQDNDVTRLMLAPIGEANTEKEGKNALIRHIREQKSYNEMLRLLYVAATRAKRCLYLSGSRAPDAKGKLKQPGKNLLLYPMWPHMQHAFEVDTEETAESTQVSEVPGFQRLKSDHKPTAWQDAWYQAPRKTVSEQTESGDLPEVDYFWAGQSARAVGTVVHRQLQQIADDGLGQWSKDSITRRAPVYRRLLEAEGLSQQEVDDATSQVGDVLQQVLGDDRGQWLLSGKHTERQSEFAITGLIDGTVINGIIDLTFVDGDDIRWIVDYKTGFHKGGNLQGFLDQEFERYRGQLERYAVLMQALDQREIRLALYFPRHQHWREWQV